MAHPKFEARKWKPGQSGNPGGRPVGTRLKLQGKFLTALTEDFEAHGVDAIRACRLEDVSTYLKIVASLMPKELEVRRPLADMSEEDLENAIALLNETIANDEILRAVRELDAAADQSRLGAPTARLDGSGTGGPSGGESTH